MICANASHRLFQVHDLKFRQVSTDVMPAVSHDVSTMGIPGVRGIVSTDSGRTEVTGDKGTGDQNMTKPVVADLLLPSMPIDHASGCTERYPSSLG